MIASSLFRDSLRRIVPRWLSDRPSTGQTVGFRVLWAMVAPLDAALDVLLQGAFAAWPGYGTTTALEWIGRSRGIVQGDDETADAYAARLRGWLDRWGIAGTQEAIARAVHEHVSGNPKVRVINRAGRCVTVDGAGVLSIDDVAFNWDSAAYPERAGWWSELWIVVYDPPWATAGTYVSGASAEKYGGELGWGHDVPRESVDAIRGLVEQWKAAHSRVRGVVWTYDPTLFDPATPASIPTDGLWGKWGKNDPRVASRSSSCRFWEWEDR